MFDVYLNDRRDHLLIVALACYDICFFLRHRSERRWFGICTPKSSLACRETALPGRPGIPNSPARGDIGLADAFGFRTRHLHAHTARKFKPIFSPDPAGPI